MRGRQDDEYDSTEDERDKKTEPAASGQSARGGQTASAAGAAVDDDVLAVSIAVGPPTSTASFEPTTQSPPVARTSRAFDVLVE